MNLTRCASALPIQLMSDWRRQRPLNAPSYAESSPDDGRTDVDSTTPFGQCARVASPCKPAVRPRIVGLLKLCRPPHVARFVIAVEVDPIKAVPCRRPVPNVGEEVLKAVQPPVTDLNATAAVAVVMISSHVIAALLDCQPCPVLGLFRHSMFQSHRAQPLSGEATARLNGVLGCAKVPRRDGRQPAAIALTFPPTVPSETKDGQAMIAIADQIEARAHGELIISAIYKGWG